MIHIRRRWQGGGVGVGSDAEYDEVKATEHVALVVRVRVELYGGVIQRRKHDYEGATYYKVEDKSRPALSLLSCIVEDLYSIWLIGLSMGA